MEKLLHFTDKNIPKKGLLSETSKYLRKPESKSGYCVFFQNGTFDAYEVTGKFNDNQELKFNLVANRLYQSEAVSESINNYEITLINRKNKDFNTITLTRKIDDEL